MGFTIAQKIIKNHLVSGTMKPGNEIALRIDQTLTQDATGTMAYLEFEAIGVERVKTELSVAYIDHNTLQCGFENADDHRYIQSVAEKYGILFSRPGNGICHQVHLERFGIPGKTLLGSDSHTPTNGGLGMLAMGAGGLDVAVAMAGGPYHINMPRMIKIELKGKLHSFVSAKDISLELLRILTVKGGVGAIIEWGGEGIRQLSVPERATITNMGAELGATASIFPSDEVTRRFLQAQGREKDFVPLESDPDAEYDQIIEINLDVLEPLAACPHSPDNVRPVQELSDVKIDQVCIGSCTNSSLTDLMKVASILKGHHVDPGVSLSISPGSKQVLAELTQNGALTDILSSGARLLECACGPCIGMGFSPNSGGVSLRTFNRNFLGRSGTKDAKIYLVSPETAAVSALTGRITDPRSIGEIPEFSMPEQYMIDDSAVLLPADIEEAKKKTIIRGPNIKEIPATRPVETEIKALLTLKVGDNISTDHIIPAGAKILPYRSNIPFISRFCFSIIDESFSDRALTAGSSIIVGGINYGQGSSREHAALVPLYLGVRAIVAKSFARIHISNLINAGILPLTFQNEEDYNLLTQGDVLVLEDIKNGINVGLIQMRDLSSGITIPLRCSFTKRQIEIIMAGGLLAYTKEKQK